MEKYGTVHNSEMSIPVSIVIRYTIGREESYDMRFDIIVNSVVASSIRGTRIRWREKGEINKRHAKVMSFSVLGEACGAEDYSDEYSVRSLIMTLCDLGYVYHTCC